MRIKGFDENLCCRGYQFEVGKEYKIENDGRPLELCSNTVFHYCESLRNVHGYYSVEDNAKNRFCEIEVLGEEVTDGEKYGSNHIRIIREIVGEELKVLKGQIDGNSGLFNSGNRNSGDWNSGDWNNGFFNTVEPNVLIFNKDSGMTAGEFRNSRYYDALTDEPFILNDWIYYTDKEKKEDPKKDLIGGYLKTYSYKEACENWWKNTSEENREIIKQIPNFDKKIFEKITGIDVDDRKWKKK